MNIFFRCYPPSPCTTCQQTQRISRGKSRSSRSFRDLQRSSWRQVCWSLWQVLFKPECYRWSVDFLLWYAEPCRCTAQRAYEQSKVGLHPCWRRTSKLMFCLKVVLRRTKMWTWLVSSVVKRNWRRQKSPPFSPKLLFLLGNPAHQVTRSQSTAPTVIPAPAPARDHTLQTRTEIPDLVALGFSDRRNPVMAVARVKGHMTQSLKSRNLDCFVHLLRCGKKLIN